MQNLNKREVQMLFYVTGIVTTSTIVLAIIVLMLGVAMVVMHVTALHILVGFRLLIGFIQLIHILHKGVLSSIVRYSYLLHRDGYVDITVHK